MTWKDSEFNSFEVKNELGDLMSLLTEDGSFSIFNTFFNETFHSKFGALNESKEKFITPSRIKEMKTTPNIRLLDVCFGIGYNTACLLEEISRSDLYLECYALEIDKRPISIGIKNKSFRNIWSLKVLEVLNDIKEKGEWSSPWSRGNLIWGDARQTIDSIPSELRFDLIYLDAFSPSRCPELWSEEFLAKLSKRLTNNGRLITYCSAAAIRGSLIRAGLEIKSLNALTSENRQWSSGTIGTPMKKTPDQEKNISCSPLTLREKEHLRTTAAIPYRDPSGQSTANEIIQRRKTEQKGSKLETTSAWKKRWNKADFQIKE